MPLLRQPPKRLSAVDGLAPPAYPFTARTRVLTPARLLLLSAPTLAASHSFIVQLSGIPLYKIAIVALIALAMLRPMSLRWTKSRLLTGYVTMLAFFTIYALISLAWAPDRQLAFAKLNNLILALALAYAMCAARIYDSSRFRYLFDGWLVAAALTLAVAVIELLSGGSLFPTTRFADSSRYELVAMSTFHNPNNFATFLILTMPLLGLAVLRASGTRRYLFLCIWSAANLFLVFAGSRGILVIAALQTAVLVMLVRVPRWVKVCAVVLGTAILASALTFSTYTMGKFTSLVLAGGLDVSVLIRLTVFLNGIWMTVESHGLGVGAGNFTYYIEHMNPPFFFRSNPSPHNMWIEIAAEYGLAVFATFAFFYIYLIVMAARMFRLARRAARPDLQTKTAVLLGMLVTYPFAVLVPSHFVANPLNWLFLTTLVLLAKRLNDNLRVATRPVA